MLVGLHDVHDEMVQTTLRALADLVGLLGGETVMGTARSNIFADATPRVRGREEVAVVGGILDILINIDVVTRYC